MTNIKNSILFLNICRENISNQSTDKEFKYFIQNEASDYQIINIIVHNEIPLEKYNIREEYKIWNLFQKIIQENTNLKVLSKLFLEMGPICEYNLSSSKIISEFMLEASDQQNYGQKVYDNMKTAMSNAKSMVNKGSAAEAKSKAEKSSDGPLDKIAVGMNSGAAASVITFASKKIQQKILEKGNRVCKGKPDKVPCMKSYKDKAMRMRIAKLRSGMSTCNKAKNAENCKKSLQKQILKLETKSDKIKR